MVQYYPKFEEENNVRYLFGVFTDVSLHQWARLKTIKSSFQPNPGPTVLGGFRTTRLSDFHMTMFYHVRKFFVSDTGFKPGTPGPLSVSLTTVLPRLKIWTNRWLKTA